MQKLSTGKDSTLGNWYELCYTFFGEDSPATQFIAEKIANSEKGKDEEVIADEGQLLYMLGKMHTDWMEHGAQGKT